MVDGYPVSYPEHGCVATYLRAYRAVFWSGLATIAAVAAIGLPRRYAWGVSGACGVAALYLNYTAIGWIDALYRMQ